MTHYFAAIPVPAGLAGSRIDSLTAQYDFPAHYKTIPDRRDLHITLHFFGALTAAEVAAAKVALQETAARTAPFTAEISGLSYFGSPSHPRVVMLSVDGGRALDRLYVESGELLEDVLKQPPRQPYIPHVTIAKKTIEGRPLPGTKEKFPPLKLDAASITLYRIEPARSPKYVPDAVFPLLGG